MVASMTAFSRQSTQVDSGILTWELRAVNHRFLEINTRLPETLRILEMSVREIIGKKIQRGKIEATLKLTTNLDTPHIKINEGIVVQLAVAEKALQQHFPNLHANLLTLLAWPGVIETEVVNTEIISTEVLKLLDRAIEDLVQMRKREGSLIKDFIEHRLLSIKNLVDEIQQQIPHLLAAERQRYIDRARELAVALDPHRLEQELVLLIQKADVAEEIQRLTAHCHAMLLILNQKEGAIGRRLDFLSQELLREANTLSSKALDISLTHASVEIKVLVEQIREQVQNIE